MSKLFKLFRSKKVDKENVLDEDSRNNRSNRHVKFGKKNQTVRNTYKNDDAHSDYDEEDEEIGSVINLRQQNSVLNPYNVVTEPKKTKSAKSWAGVVNNNDYNRHGGGGGSGRMRFCRYNRSPGAPNDLHNRSFTSDFLTTTTTMDQNLRNSKHHSKSKRHTFLSQPQQQQQWHYVQPLRERFDDNNVDSNSSTQYSAFSEYANNINRRSNKKIPSNYLQIGFSNEFKLENKIMKLESKCINYKERLIYASKTCKSLQKEKFDLETEFEELKKILINLSFENQKLKSTIEKQNEMLLNYKNNYELNFIKNDGNQRSSFYNKNQKQQQNVDNLPIFSQKYGYMGHTNTFPHNDLTSMSSNRANNIDTEKYCLNKNMQMNEINSITTSTACVRGSGESLANLSVSSTNVFSNISNNSGPNLRSNNHQQLTPKNNQTRNDFNDILIAGTSTTHNHLNQFHHQINIQRQQHRMHKKNDNFSSDGFNFQKIQQENDLTKHSTFNSIFPKNDLILSNQTNSNVIYSNSVGNEEQPSSSFLLTMKESNNSTNKYNKQKDFLNNDFNNHLQKNSLQSTTGQELCSPINFNVFMMDINKNSECSADTNSNDAESGYSALLTTPIDEEADEVKNFRSKHADSSRQDTDLEDLELIKQNLIQESLNSSSRGSIHPGVDAFSSPEIARSSCENNQNISSTGTNSLLLDSTLTEENVLNNVETINTEISLSTVSLNLSSKTNSSGELLIKKSNSSSDNSNVIPNNLYSTIFKNKFENCLTDYNKFDNDENKENLNVSLSQN